MSTSSNTPSRTMNVLAGAALLGRAAVVADAALDPLRRQPVLHRRRRQHRARRRAGCGRSHGPAPPCCDRPMLGDPGFLAQARQRVVFAEDRDHRAALAGLAHDRGRDAGQRPRSRGSPRRAASRHARGTDFSSWKLSSGMSQTRSVRAMKAPASPRPGARSVRCFPSRLPAQIRNPNPRLTPIRQGSAPSMTRR